MVTQKDSCAYLCLAVKSVSSEAESFICAPANALEASTAALQTATIRGAEGSTSGIGSYGDRQCRAPWRKRRCAGRHRGQPTCAAHGLDIASPSLRRHPSSDTPVSLQTLPSMSYRTFPDSCTFELLDADMLNDPANGRLVHLYSLVARCLSCETVFKAEEGHGLVSHAAARVVRCPTGCGEQALKSSVLLSWHSQLATPA